MRIPKTRTLSPSGSARSRRTQSFTLNSTKLKPAGAGRAPRNAPVGLACLVVALALSAAAVIFPDRGAAQSADALVITAVNLDRPTLHMLGVQVLISGDQNRNARVTVRYRPVGSNVWRDGLPLFRVLPETVAQSVRSQVPEQFAGTIFDLTPDTSYEIELHATDPDGPVDDWRYVTRSTRPVPRQNPATPNTVNVSSAAALQSALNSAAPGSVIVLADGTYAGTFAVYASGTAENPIVIRGHSATAVILDGQDCTGCNVLDVYGSYVHVEDLTIRNAFRALKFQGTGTHNNVARRLQIHDVIHGISQGTDQLDFYIADNVVEGRLTWPSVAFDPDAWMHWDDRGVAVHGDGHVVCHNRISGFGDPMISMKPLARSIDFYGNDILDSFDGTELDLGGGNVRAIHNRFTNVAAGVSLQPIYGGPAYVLRNVFLNVVQEQIKLKSLGGVEQEPSGALIYHNTAVSPTRALNLQTDITGHNFVVMNNLFVGPRAPAGRVVDWTAGVDRGKFDFDGYFPDGGFLLGKIDGVNQLFPNFAALQSSGVFESGGTLLTEPIFAGNFVGPADGTVRYDPVNFNLAASSNAVNRAATLPGINGLAGGAPDLGALELGCSTPTYGPRSAENESIAAPVDCSAPASSLPSPWANLDIGGVGLAGSANYANGTFTVNGSGADIWGAADEFQFVYQSLNGDGQIVARVNGVENTDQFAKAGLMVRETLTGGSRHVILDLKPGGGLEFMTRSAAGGSTSVVTGGITVAIPHWLKLARSGNTFTASRSSDGINWTSMGSTNVAMAANVYVGLAVTSHNDAALNTSTFDNVSVTASSGGFWTDLVGVTVNGSNGLTKNSNAAAGWNAGAYSVQALSGDGYVEFSTDENSTGKVCGLSADFAGQNYTGIDYAISLGGANQARIYENGIQKGTFSGNYEPGQKYRVSIEGGMVKYYKDGVAHSYTGAVPLAHSLRVDASLNNPGATLTNVVFFSKLSWTDLVGVTVNSTNGLTKRPDASLGWNAGAVSVQRLSGDGYVEFSTDENGTGKVIGLSTSSGGQNYTEINYAISLGAANQARIYENGALKATFTGNYVPGERFRVSVEGGVVKYYRNGVAHSYTGSVPLTHSLLIDTSLNNPGATLTDVVICGAWSN